jgi:dienelactone hydrolase
MIPALRRLSPRDTRAVVLVLHGGQEESKASDHELRPPYLRMVPFALDLFRHGRRDGVAVWLLRYRYRGWNKPDLDPVADARWALAEIHRRHPDVPVVLLGHSMGARVAFRVADDPAVVAVCALAPWTTEKDRVNHLAGRSVMIAHGDLDTTTKPQGSHAYAARIAQVNPDVRVLDIHGEGHAMLRRWRQWTLLVRRFVLGAVARPRVH